MINFRQLLSDYNIPFSSKGKHSGEGWTQIHCPYCSQTSTTGEKFHGGFNHKEEYYNCWKCNWHPLKETISILLNVPIKQTKIILKKYRGESISKDEQEELSKSPFSLPSYCKEMTVRHRQYLEQRKFDSYKLEREWGLLGTNHHGEYKLRIIIPIILDGQTVSFEGRDITGKSEMKYKACHTNMEIIPRKHIVYGFDKLKETRHKNRCIIVEGVTSVWRLGAGTIATFGIGYTAQQVLFLVQRQIKTAFIMYDPEDQAQEQAEKLSCQLAGFGVEAKIIDIAKEGGEDPATLSETKAKIISRGLLG